MAPEGPPARANPARGIALIATAVILGLFVLRQGLPVSESAADAPDAGEQSDEGSGQEQGSEGEGDGGGDQAGGGNGGDGDGGGQEETPVRPPGELTVQVANTTNVAGAAATWTTRVSENGYTTTEERQAAGEALDGTIVVHRPGHDREAAELARAIGASPDTVVPLNDEQPPVDIEGRPLMADGTQLLVLLGSDLSG